jgi:hypothetical protein
MSSNGSTPLTVPKGETWGLLLSGLGIATVISALVIQFFVIDHGSSNQITIDTEVQKSIYAVLTGVVMFILGFVLWIYFSSFTNRYLPVFLLSFVSYIVANVAVVMSLYQVTVVKT